MKFTPVTPNYQENATANESIRSRNASSNKYHVVTEEGKGRHVHSAAADSDSHDSRIDNYRFGTLATGSSSSSTSTSPFATDACESASNGIDAGVARRRSVVRRRQVASAGVVVAGRPCACCKRYNMHLRSHDDCVAWHTRSHGDAGPVRARSPSEPSHAPSRSSAREFNLRCLPEYPVAPSDSGQSPRRSLGLLCIACVVVVVVAVAAAAASCLLLARTGPLQHLGRPGAWSAGLPLHWAGNGTSSTAPAPPLPLPLPPLRREHPQPRSPLGPESSSPSDEQNRALDSDSSDLDLDLDLRRTEMDAASALQEGAGPSGSVANHSALSGTPPSPSSSSSSWAAGYGSCYEEGQGQGQEEGFVSGGGPSFPNDCPIPIPPRPRPSWEPPGLLFGRGPAPEPDPNPNLSGAGSAGRRAPYRRRRMKKLASVTISLVETINGSDSDGGGSRKKALEVLDYAVFPRGGQVVPPSTFRSAADGEYLTSAEHAPTRPTPAARKKIQIPFKIGQQLCLLMTLTTLTLTLTLLPIVAHVLASYCRIGDSAGRAIQRRLDVCGWCGRQSAALARTPGVALACEQLRPAVSGGAGGRPGDRPPALPRRGHRARRAKRHSDLPLARAPAEQQQQQQQQPPRVIRVRRRRPGRCRRVRAQPGRSRHLRSHGRPDSRPGLDSGSPDEMGVHGPGPAFPSGRLPIRPRRSSSSSNSEPEREPDPNVSGSSVVVVVVVVVAPFPSLLFPGS